MPIRPSRRALTAALAGAALVAIAAAAWSSGSLPLGLRPGGELGARTPYSSGSAEPTITLPLSTLAPKDSDRALEAYLRFWRVAQTVDRQLADRWRPILQTVTGEPLLDQLLDGFREQQARGILQYGTVTPHPTIADLTTDRATVVDCQDASESGEIDSDSGTSTVEKVGSARTAVAGVLRRDQHSTWRVTEARYLQDAC